MQVTHKLKARTSFQKVPITMTLARMLTRCTSDRFQPRAANGRNQGAERQVVSRSQGRSLFGADAPAVGFRSEGGLGRSESGDGG